MNHIIPIEHLALTLQNCLESLDALGFAAAAAFVDSAIRILPESSDTDISGQITRVIDLSSDIDFSEIDRLVELYFKH